MSVGDKVVGWWARRWYQRGLEGKEGENVMSFLKQIQGLRSAIIAVLLLAEFLGKSFGFSGPFSYVHQLFAIAGWDPKEALFDPTVTGTAVLTLYAVYKRARTWWGERTLAVPKLPGALVLAVLALGLCVGCGDSTLPSDPTTDVSPAPVQKIVSLAVTIRQAGVIVEAVNRDTYFTVEAAPRCSDASLPCPRPSRLEWGVFGAFCEILGDKSAPSIVAVCAGGGVTNIKAEDLDSGAKGTASVQIRF